MTKFYPTLAGCYNNHSVLWGHCMEGHFYWPKTQNSGRLFFSRSQYGLATGWYLFICLQYF
jgi:hypothetical protein